MASKSCRALVPPSLGPFASSLRTGGCQCSIACEEPLTALTSVPGIGRRFADRLHDELGINTLEELEAAAHDGRLSTIAGFGSKRVAGIRDSLAHRLGRVRLRSDTPSERPPVTELLDVDREYREKASAGDI